MQKFGIDVSRYQGNFNFAQAKKEGIEFALLKAGGSDGANGSRYKDSKYEQYYMNCKTAGIPCGAYYFGADTTEEAAVESAKHFVEMLKGKQFEYPVYYDVEGKMLSIPKDMLNRIIEAFCSTVQSAGFFVGIYASASPFRTHITDKKYTHWVASYGTTKPDIVNIDIWQYGGTDNFIRSNIVAGVICDQDYCYRDFPAVIKEKKLNGFEGGNMTSTEFVDKLKYIVNLPTVYSNKYPRNLGYWDGEQYSFDCWNLIKAIINGWTDTRVVGYYQKDLSITGDIDGATILKRCTKQSQDFTQLTIPGTYLFIRNTHAGVFVGEHKVVIDGAERIVNVIECTGAWTRNVLWSYVDPTGCRCRYKGAAPIGKWTDWGLMCWIDYNSEPAPAPTIEAARPTLRLKSKGEQVRILQGQLISLGYSCGRYGADGDYGNDTKAAVLNFQRDVFAEEKEHDGEYGPKTCAKLTEALNRR